MAADTVPCFCSTIFNLPVGLDSIPDGLRSLILNGMIPYRTDSPPISSAVATGTPTSVAESTVTAATTTRRLPIHFPFNTPVPLAGSDAQPGKRDDSQTSNLGRYG